jgi:hypothetical protein
MATSENYEKGIDVLRLSASEKLIWDERIGQTSISDKSGGYRYRDLRTDPAFAWRVLEAFVRYAEEVGYPATLLMRLPISRTLYAAVEQLGAS